MSMERDKAEFLSGLRNSVTLGSPIAIFISNKDAKISCFGKDAFSPLLCPRPGHADLSGMLKYDFRDLRNIWERSSARSTAILVAFGALAKQLLKKFGMSFLSYTINIGGIRIEDTGSSFSAMEKRVRGSALRCPDKKAENKMLKKIKEAAGKGDSLGGTFDIMVSGVPAGLGSHADFESKLDARIASSLISIQSIKGVEFGLGFGYAQHHGSGVHDEIFYSRSKGFYRKTNNAGGIEGGISNGQDIIVRCAVKPVPSLKVPLRSVNVKTKKAKESCVLRSDVCVVPAASLIAEDFCALVILDAFLEKFGKDNYTDIKSAFSGYTKRLKSV